LTEFIPVSSTGHLLLASQFLDFSYFTNGVFEIVIQLGAILAVCCYYHKKILEVITGITKKQAARNFTINLLLAFLPSVIFGVLFYQIIKSWFFSPIPIALALIIGGFIIIFVEKLNIKPKYTEIDNLTK